MERLPGAGPNKTTDDMNLADAVNDVDSRQFDPAEVTTKDKAICLSAAPKAIHTSDADEETVASQTAPSLALALARYITDLGLDQGINLLTEARRFERGLIERALELTKGNQRRAATLLGIQPSSPFPIVACYRVQRSASLFIALVA